MRKLTYEVTSEKNHIEPRIRRWAGMQYEDNATEVVFDLSVLKHENALYRIDFNSAGAGYQPSENLEILDGKIRRSIPKLITQYGGEMQVTAVVTLLDQEGKETNVCLSYPVIVYFTEVEKSQPGTGTVEGNISQMEATVRKLTDSATEAARSAAESEEAAQTAQKLTEQTRATLEDGEFVFLGGDANGSVDVKLTVDDEISDVSTNPVQSRAIAEAITKIRADVNDGLSSVNAELSNVNAELSDVEKKTNKVEAIYDDATETQYPNVKAVKEYVDRAVDYIEKQGTNGIWTYEKWSSGKAVCYATVNQTLNFTDKYVGEIYHTVANVTFPSNLFIDPPKVWLEILSAGGLFVKSVREITKDNFSYYIGEFSSSPISRTLDITIEAKGRWK